MGVESKTEKKQASNGPYISLFMILISFYAGWFHLIPSWYRPYFLTLFFYELFLFYKVRYSKDVALKKLKPASCLVANACVICNTMKPPRFYHCRTCNQCRFRMDHHCYWIDNCVFFTNTKIFVQFLLSTFIVAMHILLLLLYNIGSVVGKNSSWLKNVSGCLLGLLALFVCFESYRLLDDQHSCILENQTLIEGYKNLRGKSLTYRQNFESVFGNSWIYWILPIQGPFKANILEKTYKCRQSSNPENQNDQIEQILGNPQHPRKQEIAKYQLSV